MEGRPNQPALAASAARAAAAAGVKPAALVTHLNPTRMIPHDRTLPKPAFELTEKKPESAPAKKAPVKNRVRKSKGMRSKKIVAKRSASGTKVVATTTDGVGRKRETQ